MPNLAQGPRSCAREAKYRRQPTTMPIESAVHESAAHGTLARRTEEALRASLSEQRSEAGHTMSTACPPSRLELQQEFSQSDPSESSRTIREPPRAGLRAAGACHGLFLDALPEALLSRRSAACVLHVCCAYVAAMVQTFCTLHSRPFALQHVVCRTHVSGRNAAWMIASK